jgi:hypothetical protein
MPSICWAGGAGCSQDDHPDHTASLVVSGEAARRLDQLFVEHIRAFVELVERHPGRNTGEIPQFRA